MASASGLSQWILTTHLDCFMLAYFFFMENDQILLEKIQIYCTFANVKYHSLLSNVWFVLIVSSALAGSNRKDLSNSFVGTCSTRDLSDPPVQRNVCLTIIAAL